MMSYSSASRSLLLAGAFFGAFTLSAVAQQPAAPKVSLPPVPGMGPAPVLRAGVTAGPAPLVAEPMPNVHRARCWVGGQR